jgi:signal transduction histidine kinase/ligand-binding sensor domain-containing protein/CheY-like chemotaxis protein/HPt (histidine-containing phosphotransfer) domain-containing protein
MLARLVTRPRRFVFNSGAVLFHTPLVLLIVFLLTSGVNAAAPLSDPEYLIDNWETDQGLPQNSATAIVQTPDGYLWFGTFNGLVRFDGVQFTVFDCSNTPELPGTEVVNLHLDRSNRLWVSTSLGIAYVKDGKWKAFSRAQGWVGDFVRHFAESATGDLYLTTFNCKFLHFLGDGFEELPVPPGVLSRLLVPVVDEQGTVWAVTGEFISHYHDGRWQFITNETRGEAQAVAAGPARDGGFWVLTRERIRKYRRGKLVFDRPGPSEGLTVWKAYEDSAGAVWFCCNDSGLHRFTTDGHWRNFTKQTSLGCDSVRCIFEDRENNLWVGTDGAGLYRFHRRIFRNWAIREGLPERIVNTVTGDAQGRIVVGLHGHGIAELKDGAISRPQATAPLGGPVQPFVNSVLIDSKKRLWVGGLGDGLLLLDEKGSRKFDAADMGLDPGDLHVFSLFEDSRSRIWIGTDRGLTRYNQSGFKTFSLPVVSPLHSIRCIAEDRRTGMIWAGHHAGGLYMVTEDGLRVVSSGDALSISERIASLYVSADGTLWIGTEDKGLICRTPGSFKRIGEAEGLPARQIGTILEDGAGHIWLGSNRGVLRLRRDDIEAVVSGRRTKLDCLTFGPEDGLATRECTIGMQPTSLRDNKGKLWFTTAKGLAMVDPDNLRLNPLPPPVAIHEVWVDGRLAARLEPLHTSLDSATLSVAVPAGSRRIDIHYAGLSLSAPAKMHFRFLLDGLDANWVDVGNRRVAYLQDLSPGEYKFRVQAANNDGVWNEEGATITLTVLPFAWQTLWFKAVGVFVGIGTATLAGRQLTRARLRRQLERLEQQAERKARLAADAANRAKSEFLANMSHEIRTPMNGILGMTEQVLETTLTREQRDCLGLVKSSADHLLDVINDILDFSKIEAGKLDLDPIRFDLHRLFADTLKSLEIRAKKKSLFLICNISESVPRQVIGDPGRLRQILVNLVGNAIKFTEQGGVTLTVNRLSQAKTADILGETAVQQPTGDNSEHVELQIAVSDTGIGIAAGKQKLIFDPFTQADGSTTRQYGGTGLGLTISSRLVSLMGGRLTVASDLGKGSCFSFQARFQIRDGATSATANAGDSELQPERDEIPSDLATSKLPPRPESALLSPRLRILLVEDNTVNQRLALRLLEKRGHAVTIAGNGECALATLDGQEFDVILMDVQMPVMDGLETTREIRLRERGTARHTPIVAMTAHAMKGDRERCLAAGMDDYLSKPIQSAELLETLRRVTAQTPAADVCHATAARADTLSSRELALQRLEGDEELLREIESVFTVDAPELLQFARAAQERGDSAELRRVAHRLKGAVAYFDGGAATEAAVRLERIEDCADSSQAANLLSSLEREVNSLLCSLGAVVSPSRAGTRPPATSSLKS